MSWYKTPLREMAGRIEYLQSMRLVRDSPRKEMYYTPDTTHKVVPAPRAISQWCPTFPSVARMSICGRFVDKDKLLGGILRHDKLKLGTSRLVPLECAVSKGLAQPAALLENTRNCGWVDILAECGLEILRQVDQKHVGELLDKALEVLDVHVRDRLATTC
jgi:hypothetical protein